MKKSHYIVALFLLIFSCKDNKIVKPEKPDDLISESKMVDVIYDMLLLSAAKGVNKQIMETKGVHPDEYVYLKHEIDSIQFKKSVDYYAYDIERYEGIYARVKRKLETDKSTFQKNIDDELAKRDSIVKSNKRRDSIQRAIQRKRNDSMPKSNGVPSLLKKEEQFP